MCPKNESQKWSCWNCRNLKRRTITGMDLEGISKSQLEGIMGEEKKRAIYLNEINPKLPAIPISWGIFRKARSKGSCKVVYCKLDLLKRHVYELKPKFENSSAITLEKKCPKYI